MRCKSRGCEVVIEYQEYYMSGISGMNVWSGAWRESAEKRRARRERKTAQEGGSAAAPAQLHAISEVA
jgi:hypothetical protein